LKRFGHPVVHVRLSLGKTKSFFLGPGAEERQPHRTKPDFGDILKKFFGPHTDLNVAIVQLGLDHPAPKAHFSGLECSAPLSLRAHATDILGPWGPRDCVFWAEW